MQDLSRCEICPRKCGVNREKGNVGVCRTDIKIAIARAAPHYWEEPCISGKNGSGTVFFSGCNLGCVYCQNREISRFSVGKEVSVAELAAIFENLQEKGVHNINLVTPSHFVPQISAALDIAKLNIPVVYNSGGYDSPETLDMLDSKVKIFLPDFKYMSCSLGEKFSNAPDYPEIAKAAIKKMFSLGGKPRFDKDGIMKSGVIVRHLVLPDHADDSKAVIKYLYDTYGDNIYISIMNQYTPVCDTAYAELGHAVSDEEYAEVVSFAEKIGVKNAFIQEGGTVSESFIPEFDTKKD